MQDHLIKGKDEIRLNNQFMVASLETLSYCPGEREFVHFDVRKAYRKGLDGIAKILSDTSDSNTGVNAAAKQHAEGDITYKPRLHSGSYHVSHGTGRLYLGNPLVWSISYLPKASKLLSVPIKE
jgi:hypothetical protein